MIEFEVLTMKAETNNIHIIFLLKKNVRTDIIKMILGYLPMAVPEILKEWKVTITSFGQEYKSIENQHNYRTGTGIIYREKGIPIDIGKAKDNFNKDRRSKCFNCNIYRYIAKECKKPKKEQDMRKCYKCNKVEHIAKDYRLGQKIKNQMRKKTINRRILPKVQSRHDTINLCT